MQDDSKPKITGAMRHAQRVLPEEPLSPELVALLRRPKSHQIPADCKPLRFSEAMSKLDDIRARRESNRDQRMRIATGMVAITPLPIDV